MVKHTEKQQQINQFERFWELGYTSLIPVVPPHGGITNAGKRPGVRGLGDKWYGKASADFTATPDTIEAWHQWGASVGLSCNETGVFGLDIDTLSTEWADYVVGLAHEMLGVSPRRIGRSPKVLLVYRCDPSLRYMQLRFFDGRPGVVDAKGRVKEQPAMVEVLAGEAKWFVIAGIHPTTKQPYSWPDGVWPKDRLPLVTEEQLRAFLDVLRTELPRAQRTASGAAPGPRNDNLKGDPALVAAAMRSMPNSIETTDYHSWCRIGAALRGALPDHHALALELFEEFTDKADIPDDEKTERADRVFYSFDEGHLSLGANYIYDLAQQAGWPGEGRPAPWFDPGPWPGDEPELTFKSIFGEGDETLSATVADLSEPRAIPPRAFLYGGHLVRGFVSMTSAPSKVGKTTLITTDALAMATGRALLPWMKPHGQLRVWYINLEDPFIELRRRFQATAMKFGVTAADLGDRLHIDGGRDFKLIVAKATRDGVVMQAATIDALIAALRRQRIDVLMLDPFVATHRVAEGDNLRMEEVVEEWVRIADVCDIAIEIVHHARKATGDADLDASIASVRGGSAITAKMRSVRTLVGMDEKQAARFLGSPSARHDYFRIADAASNLARWVSDDTRWLRKESVDLGNGPGDEAQRWLDGDHVAVAVAWTAGQDGGATVDQRASIIEAVRSGEWMKDMNARGGWVGNAIAAALNLDIDEPNVKATVKLMITKLLAEGVLRLVTKLNEHRKPRVYVEAASVFD